jgi:hypothetical protein
MTHGKTVEPDEERGIGILTQPSTDGSHYQLVLTVGDDFSQAFDRDEALVYGIAMLEAAQTAEYIGAIATQLGKLDVDEDGIRDVLRELLVSMHRPVEMPVGPFLMRAGEARKTGEPMLMMKFQGEVLGSWTMEQARSHAMWTIEAATAADFDTAYHRMLIDHVELEDDVARAVVAGLAEERWTL